MKVNIITGFLGAGKTTTIKHLLRQKPANQRWAVLVNEFGKVGIDGSLLEGEFSPAQGVYVEEVAGGCMCCTAGLSMQIALGRLLSTAKPDRLLIEPTGLGHPLEVWQMLQMGDYKQLFDIQKIITVVDARKLNNPSCNNNATFVQQLAMADVVIANKQDLYQQNDHTNIEATLKRYSASTTDLIFTSEGALNRSVLEGSSNIDELHVSNVTNQLDSQDTFNTQGWRFDAGKVFNHDRLVTVLASIKVERMKAVFITNKGIFGYNLTPDSLTEIALDDSLDSKIEIISDQTINDLEPQLLSCLDLTQQ